MMDSTETAEAPRSVQRPDPSKNQEHQRWRFNFIREKLRIAKSKMGRQKEQEQSTPAESPPAIPVTESPKVEASIPEKNDIPSQERPLTPLQETQQIIRGNIAQWKKDIIQMQVQMSAPSTGEGYRQWLPDAIRLTEARIGKNQTELEHPTWSSGVRSSNPEDFAYHGLTKGNLEDISKTGLVPQAQKDDPSKFLIWFTGPNLSPAYGGQTILRFPAGIVGEDRVDPNAGPGSTDHGIPAYLIDASEDGGKTWRPISESSIKPAA